MSGKKIRIKVDLKKNTLDAARYAAYSVSGAAFVLLRTAPGKSVSVELTPKDRASAAVLKRRFLAELADEKLREAVADNNRELREFLLLKALSPEPPKEETPDTGLTPEQERELEDLISQVEKEISEDAGRTRDPMGINKTWEEKYAKKKRR